MQTIVSSQGFEYGVKHFFAPHKGRAIDIIQSVLNLSDSEFMELFKLGAIYTKQQRLTEFNLMLAENTMIRIHTKPRRYFCDYDWEKFIVFQNDDFLILNKPAGVPSHPSVDNIIENSLTQTEYATGEKLHISHRLDTTTEGLIVYGKTKDFVKSFNQQIQNHTIEKNYVALCETDEMLPKKVIHYMEQSPRAPKKVSAVFSENSDFCELEIIEQKKMDTDLSWVKINLLTGRTHQIRAQMSELKAPLCGDVLYGARRPWNKNTSDNKNAIPQIALRSQMIDFFWNDKRHRFELPEQF
jgi:23S rRNA pseudouridine1911/1915/1917 synthase